MDKSQGFRYFGAYDYAVVSFMLVSSTMIGVFYAFFAKQKQNTPSEYLLGGRNIGLFPISMSLIASYLTGITYIGLPSEMYVYGTQYWVATLGEIFTAFFTAYALIPVFYTLQITSSYEYFNRRFNVHVRTLASLMFLCKMILYIPIILYVPSVAFAQVTGFSLQLVIPVICVVCTFYCTIGGLRAVVWTDTLQIMLMIFTTVVVTVLGTRNAGGIEKVMLRNLEGGRIDFFNMSWDPRVRHTFWNVIIGKIFQHTATCTVNQAMVQRCLALPSLKLARISVAMLGIGVAFFVNLSCYTGLLIYAEFYDCDPVKAGLITKADELFPFYAMKMAKDIPLLLGIFVSGVFSASLSTMSTGLNAMCGVILEDFIRPLYKKPIPDEQSSLIMKITTIILGTICLVLTFGIKTLGGLLQTALTLQGVSGGTLLGMFLLGMFFPWANTVGALSGGVAATILVAWMTVGSQLAIYKKELTFPTKPISLDGCSNISMSENINGSFHRNNNDSNELFILYQISYVYYTFIGVVTVIVVGLLFSYFTGFNNLEDVNPDVISPVIHSFLRRKMKIQLERPMDEDVTTSIINPEQCLHGKPEIRKYYRKSIL